jgi:hypothetical protein
MSSDQTSAKPADQIEELPAVESAEVAGADQVRGGIVFDTSTQRVMASPTGDADYLPYGRLNPVPGLGKS